MMSSCRGSRKPLNSVSEVQGAPDEPLDFVGVQRVTVSARHRSLQLKARI